MTDLAWTDHGGSGRPFVLVHGFTGSSADFGHVVHRFTDMRRVITLDLPGHGASPRLDEYSFRALSNVVIDFLREVIGEGVDLLGHSMGGRIVLPVAFERPESVRSLVLMDTWGDDVDRSSDPRMSDFSAIFELADEDAVHAWEGYIDPPSVEGGLIEERLPAEWRDVRDDMVSDRLAAVQLGRLVFGRQVSLLRDATTIACPTTVMVGEHDRAYLGPSERLASHIPGAREIVIGDAYHSPQLTHADEWTRAVREHLAWVQGTTP
jgi:pimeloyl-ACP methyl ester carboxylesterase